MLDQHHGGPLEGILVVALEQAVAAPYAVAGLPTRGLALSKSSGLTATLRVATTRQQTGNHPILFGSIEARSRSH